MNIFVNASMKAVFCVCALVLFAAFASAAPVEETDAYDSIIETAAKRHGLDPLLVKAVVWRESRFNPAATGKSGEIGLMQISMFAVRDWAKANSKTVPARESVYDPQTNITIGVWYLSRGFSSWNGNPYRIELALCQYNAGRRKLLNWIAHYDGSYSNVIENSASAPYVRDILDKHTEYSVAAESAKAEAVAVNTPANKDL